MPCSSARPSRACSPPAAPPACCPCYSAPERPPAATTPTKGASPLGKKEEVRLTFPEKWAVANHLKNIEETIRHRRPLFRELAEEVSKDTGIAVNERVVASLCRDIGISWEACIDHPRYRRPQEQIKALEEKATALEEKDRQLKAEVAVLRGLVHHLYAELNARPPAGYLLPNGRCDQNALTRSERSAS